MQIAAMVKARRYHAIWGGVTIEGCLGERRFRLVLNEVRIGRTCI